MPDHAKRVIRIELDRAFVAFERAFIGRWRELVPEVAAPEVEVICLGIPECAAWRAQRAYRERVGLGFVLRSPSPTRAET